MSNARRLAEAAQRFLVASDGVNVLMLGFHADAAREYRESRRALNALVGAALATEADQPALAATKRADLSDWLAAERATADGNLRRVTEDGTRRGYLVGFRHAIDLVIAQVNGCAEPAQFADVKIRAAAAGSTTAEVVAHARRQLAELDERRDALLQLLDAAEKREATL